MSRKLRTAPKRCFPLPAVWCPPSSYLIHTPTAAHSSSIFSNPDSTNQIHPSLIPSTKAINPPPCCVAILNHGQANVRLQQKGRNQGISSPWGKEAVEWGKRTQNEGWDFFFHHSPTRLEWWLMLLKRASLPEKCGLLLPVQQRGVLRGLKISHPGTTSVLAASGPSSTGSHQSLCQLHTHRNTPWHPDMTCTRAGVQGYREVSSSQHCRNHH